MTTKQINIPAEFISGDRRQKTFVTNGKFRRDREKSYILQRQLFFVFI
jgi:hypothetical protein